MGSRLEQNSNAVRKRIENHAFSDETGEEYEPSAFGGFSDYFRRKKIKLQNLDSELRASSSDKPQIFKGVVAHVTGYTQPPLHVLHRDLVEHGAGFIQYLDSKTMATHIITSSLPPKKMIEFNKYKIVKPTWVIDSIQAGRLLPWSDYRVIEETPRQKTLKLDGNGMSTQSSTQQSPITRYREQTDNSFYTGQLKDIAERIDGRHDEYLTPSRPKYGEFPGQNDSDKVEGIAAAGDVTRASPLEHKRMSDEDNNFDKSNESKVQDGVLLTVLTNPDNHQEEISTAPQRDPDLELERQRALTSEEHNALLLKDPRMRKSSTANPDFIRQYYSESRLHHLSTWKADLKSRMQRLAAEKGQQSRPKRKPGTRRYIMHVDFDSFFCAVSLKSAPEFVDKPTVVAHGTGTGSEIASCNYPARKHGVKNGMWMKRAKELYPDLKVLPYDFPAYEEASKLFYESILEVGGVVQSVSIDEALVDVTSIILSAIGSTGTGVDEGSIWREQEKADQVASALREKIKDRTGCAVSVGIGGNILLAKVALRRAKPAGQYQIKPEEIQSFLGALKVDDLPGVAYSITGKLEEIGVTYVNDIRQTSKERLINALGPKTGEKLWEYARGIDRTEVGEQPIRKSVSAEVNWGIRFLNQEEAEEFVFNLCKELEKRLLNEQVKGKQLTMKIMRRSLDAPLDPPKHLGHGKCDTFNKSILYGVATNDYQTLGKEAVAILRSYKFSPGDLRGLGVQLTKLEPIRISLTGPDGSQKRLSFGGFKTPGSTKKPIQDPIHDTVRFDETTNSPQERNDPQDPIADGPLTPRKPKLSAMHPALTIARAGDRDAKAKTPLNIAGTQFIMPSTPDPSVLAELPPDIRAKLVGQFRVESERRTPETADPPARADSPSLIGELPAGVDPEVFNALPDDVKAEVLGSYKMQRKQALLPQSPRKDRIIQPTKKVTPKKGRGPGLFSRARERQADANAKVVQTNFLSLKNTHVQHVGKGADVEELDQVFLTELPEDVRREVIADHRRRKAQRLGLDLKMNKHQRNQGTEEGLPGGQARILFPPRPAKVTFTSGGLTTLPELRDMINVWHRETQIEGPHRRDVEMLEKYLVQVVLEERDMDKVVKLIKYLHYLVDEDESESYGREVWHAAVQDIRREVQRAVRSRGLGPLEMG